MLSLMLASPPPPSLLDIYNLSTLSLGCNALCMVISFLVLWSICLSSSQVHFRRGTKYLMRDTAQVFIPLIRFQLESFVSNSFPVPLRYSFLFCLSFPLVWWCQPPRCPSIYRSPPWEFFIWIINILMNKKINMEKFFMCDTVSYFVFNYIYHGLVLWTKTKKRVVHTDCRHVHSWQGQYRTGRDSHSGCNWKSGFDAAVFCLCFLSLRIVQQVFSKGETTWWVVKC